MSDPLEKSSLSPRKIGIDHPRSHSPSPWRSASNHFPPPVSTSSIRDALLTHLHPSSSIDVHHHPFSSKIRLIHPILGVLQLEYHPPPWAVLGSSLVQLIHCFSSIQVSAIHLSSILDSHPSPPLLSSTSSVCPSSNPCFQPDQRSSHSLPSHPSQVHRPLIPRHLPRPPSWIQLLSLIRLEDQRLSYGRSLLPVSDHQIQLDRSRYHPLRARRPSTLRP